MSGVKGVRRRGRRVVEDIDPELKVFKWSDSAPIEELTASDGAFGSPYSRTSVLAKVT